MKNTLDRHRFITNISHPWRTLDESTDVLRSARAATFFILFFLMSFFSFSFLLFSSRFCWVVFKQEKERERERTNFLLFLRTQQKEKKYVFCLRSKSRADVRYKKRSSKQTTNALCLSSSWAFSSLHLKPLWHFYSRARNIFYYGFLFFLLSLVLMSDSTLFFFFVLAKSTGGGLSFWSFQKKRRERRREGIFFVKYVFSLLFSSPLFFTLFSLCAHENTSHRIFFRHTSTTQHKTLTEIASGT